MAQPVTPSEMIVRHVTVDRTRAPKNVLDATGRKRYADDKVVKAMQKGSGEDADVHFFKVDRFLRDDDLENEYELRGLRPVDPYSLAAVNEVDPAFADKYPNGTHWKDSDGLWCHASFCRWNEVRELCVNRHGDGWGVSWWFAGVRK